MKGKYLTTIIISAVFLAVIAGYFTLVFFRLVKSGLGAFTIIVIIIALALVGVMIYTMIDRLKEQEKENPDDYRKY